MYKDLKAKEQARSRNIAARQPVEPQPNTPVSNKAPARPVRFHLAGLAEAFTELRHKPEADFSGFR